ncbi:MAG: heme-binding domain-containing protein [Bacteriovoracaceae bacterium]
MKLTILPFLFLFVSCLTPSKNDGALNFKVKENRQAIIQQMKDAEEAEKERIRLLQIEKEKTWKTIITNANNDFEDIAPLIQKKCFACHDANTKEPPYAKIFPSINPVHQHQVDGIAALDFSKKFPLKAKGNPPQVALLKGIRNQVIDREMPLKIYTFFYPKRKIDQNDEERILAWVDPLIEKIEDYERRFETSDQTPDGRMNKIFEMKCFRCHANGNDSGDFANMQDTKALLASKYINLKNPSDSLIYKLSANQSMPPNKRDALSEEELTELLEWIKSKAN